MRRFLEKYLNSKTLIIFGTLTIIIYIFMLWVSMPKIAIYSDGMPMFDMMFSGYDQNYALKFMKTLGEEGRNAYLFPQLTIDLFFPLAYVPTFILLICIFLKKTNLFSKPIFYISLLPLFTGIFDYGENLSVIFMLCSFPYVSQSITEFSSMCTVLKSTTLMADMLLIALCFIWFLLYKLIKRIYR